MPTFGFEGSVDDKQFSRMMALYGPRVLVESPTSWAPTVTGADRTVSFAVGAGRILGLRHETTGAFTVQQAANATGANRIDLVVMRANYATNTVTPTAITGSSATLPPAINKSLLTTGDVYDFPILAIVTPNGAGAYNANALRDIRPYGGAGGMVVPQAQFLNAHDLVPGQRWLVADGLEFEVDSSGVLQSLGPPIIIARGRRTTTSTSSASTTDVPVLRLDDHPVAADLSYAVRVMCHPASSVATDVVRVTVRYTTDGSTPTISSPVLPGARIYRVASSATSACLEAEYVPGAAQTLSLLLCVARFSGTGNVNLFCDADRFTELKVIANGPDVTNTGTNL